MSNPFETPMTFGSAPTGGRRGDFDIGVAFADGWAATQRNWLSFIGMWLVVGFAAMLAVIACVLPVFVVIPALVWGVAQFTLHALDGEARVGTVTEPFGRLGEVVLPMIVVLLLSLAVSLPGMLASWALQFGALAAADWDSTSLTAIAGQAFGSVVSMVWSLVVTVRFSPMTYLVVEGGLKPLDAFSESWTLTSTCWLKLIGANILFIITVVVGMLACCVGIIPASMTATAAQASIYRQLIGRR